MVKNVENRIHAFDGNVTFEARQIKVFERQFHYQNNRPCLQKY
jgi:hypothetical protein